LVLKPQGRSKLIIGLAAAALIGSAQINGSFAQTGDKTPPAQSEQKPGPAANQIANDVDARIALLEANLRLTVDQERNWPGLQTAMHDY